MPAAIAAGVAGLGAIQQGATAGRLAGRADKGIRIPQLQDIFGQLQILRFLELGGSLNDLFVGKGKDKATRKKLKEEGLTLGVDAFRSGNKVFRVPNQQRLKILSDRREVDIRQSQAKSFQLLKDSPLFAGLIQGADGSLSPQFRLDGAFNKIANTTLGGAARTGLNIADPLVQAKVLGPVALQAAQARRQFAAQQSQNALSLVNRPGGAPSFLRPRGISELQQNVFTNLGFQQNAQTFNADAVNTSLGIRAGLAGQQSAGLGQLSGQFAGMIK